MTHAPAVPRSRAALATATSLGLGLALVLTGCSSQDPAPESTASSDTRQTSTPEPTMTSGTADSAAATTPEDALQRAGLQLPAGASDVVFEDVTSADSPLLEHYRVAFTVPRDAAIAFCGSGDLGGDLPALDLTASEQERLGVPAASGESPRLCASQLPANVAWDRIVLIDGDDPARVIASLGKMGR